MTTGAWPAPRRAVGDDQAGANVNDLVAVVTGGGSGNGLAIAKILAQNGAKRIYIIDRRRAKLAEAVKRHAVRGNITAIRGDVTSQDSLRAIAEQIKRETGYLHLLVAASETPGPKFAHPPPATSTAPSKYTIEGFVSQAWSSPSEDFTRAFDINVTSVYYSILAFLPLLAAGNAHKFHSESTSQIVAFSSTPIAKRSSNSGFSYASSKAALTQMMKAMSTLCARWDIRANLVQPGGLSSLGLSRKFMFPIPVAEGEGEDGEWEDDDDEDEGSFVS